MPKHDEPTSVPDSEPPRETLSVQDVVQLALLNHTTFSAEDARAVGIHIREAVMQFCIAMPPTEQVKFLRSIVEWFAVDTTGKPGRQFSSALYALTED